MKYFRETKTGEVYAYSKEDLEQVAKVTGSSPRVFHEIESKLKGMRELIGEELENHLNPVPTDEVLAGIGRSERDEALGVLDVFVSNPLRYAELSAIQQKEARDYRQALLDVPQQKSFPKTYTMPEIPTWLS